MAVLFEVVEDLLLPAVEGTEIHAAGGCAVGPANGREQAFVGGAGTEAGPLVAVAEVEHHAGKGRIVADAIDGSADVAAGLKQGGQAIDVEAGIVAGGKARAERCVLLKGRVA